MRLILANKQVILFCTLWYGFIKRINTGGFRGDVYQLYFSIYIGVVAIVIINILNLQRKQ
jgi:hypothetical protein